MSYRHLSGAQKRQKNKREEQLITKHPRLDRFLSSVVQGQSSSAAASLSNAANEASVIILHDSDSDGSDSIETPVPQSESTNPSTLPKTRETVEVECESSPAEEEVSKDIRIDAAVTEDVSSLFELSQNVSTDPSHWYPMTSAVRDYLISRGPDHCRNNDGIFENSVTKSDYNRKLPGNIFFSKSNTNNIEYKRDWLLYSPSQGSVFCFHCCLFTNNKTSWTYEGFHDWKHVHARVREHELSSQHLVAIKAYIARRHQENLIDADLTRQLDAEREYWIKVLERVVEVIKFLAVRGLAFRGAEEIFGSIHNGNYMGALELLSKFDPFLKQHIDKFGNCGKGNVSYLSSTICEEFVELMGERVLNVILDEIRDSKYYSITCDSTPDITHTDQLSIAIRYLKNNEPLERFIAFVPIFNHTAESLTNVILKFLNDNNISIENCRGQSYDNAPNMAGMYSGLQARIIQINQLAIFIPCSGHSLNLVGNSAVESNNAMANYFGILQQLYNFLSASPYRWDVLKNELDKENVVVKDLSATRWSARADAVHAVSSSLPAIIRALQKIKDEPLQKAIARAEASGLLKSIGTLEFMLKTVFWNDILQRFNAANATVQTAGQNLETVVKLMNSLKEYAENMKEQFKNYEDLARTKSGCENYEEKRKTTTSSKMRFLTGETSKVQKEMSPSEKFENETFLPVLDCLILELNKRGQSYENAYSKFEVLAKLHSLSTDEIIEKGAVLAGFYGEDVVEMVQELTQLKFYLGGPMPIEQIYRKIIADGVQATFLSTFAVLKIYMVLVVANCTTERSFSRLKLVKTRLRSTTSDARLGNLVVLAQNADVTNKVSFKTLVEDFAEKKSRKKI